MKQSKVPEHPAWKDCSAVVLVINVYQEIDIFGLELGFNQQVTSILASIKRTGESFFVNEFYRAFIEIFIYLWDKRFYEFYEESLQ
jgi:hypothetical protein